MRTKWAFAATGCGRERARVRRRKSVKSQLERHRAALALRRFDPVPHDIGDPVQRFAQRGRQMILDESALAAQRLAPPVGAAPAAGRCRAPRGRGNRPSCRNAGAGRRCPSPQGPRRSRSRAWPSFPLRAGRRRGSAAPADPRRSSRPRPAGSRRARRACSGRWRAWRGTCCRKPRRWRSAGSPRGFAARISSAMRVAEPMPSKIVGHIEIGLVEAQRLDMRGVVVEDRADLLRHFAVGIEARLARRSDRGRAASRRTDGMAERTPNVRAS